VYVERVRGREDVCAETAGAVNIFFVRLAVYHNGAARRTHSSTFRQQGKPYKTGRIGGPDLLDLPPKRPK